MDFGHYSASRLSRFLSRVRIVIATSFCVRGKRVHNTNNSLSDKPDCSIRGGSINNSGNNSSSSSYGNSFRVFATRVAAPQSILSVLSRGRKYDATSLRASPWLVWNCNEVHTRMRLRRRLL